MGRLIGRAYPSGFTFTCCAAVVAGRFAGLGACLFNDLVGALSLVGGCLRFQYSPDWLAQPNSVALSQSLPLGPDAFDDHMCRGFFACLLPEGNLRRLIARQCQVSSHNDFALLNAIGGECAGAVTFVPVGHSLATAEQAGVDWLDQTQLIALLDELPRRPMLVGREGIRLSLAGAQDKLPVVFDGERIVARQLQASSRFADQSIVANILDLIEQRSALTNRRLLEGLL